MGLLFFVLLYAFTLGWGVFGGYIFWGRNPKGTVPLKRHYDRLQRLNTRYQKLRNENGYLKQALARAGKGVEEGK